MIERIEQKFLDDFCGCWENFLKFTFSEYRYCLINRDRLQHVTSKGMDSYQ